MTTLCIVLSLLGRQPTVHCSPMSHDMVAESTLACVHDPILDCTAQRWHAKNIMILTIKRLTP